jgi:hypothetical protein
MIGSEQAIPPHPRSASTSWHANIKSPVVRTIHSYFLIVAALSVSLSGYKAAAVIRDGGIDPANLGKGGWVLDPLADPDSYFAAMRAQGFRYVIVKAGRATELWTGSWSDWASPSNPTGAMFNSALVQSAHNNGLLIFASNRSGGDTKPFTIDAAEIAGEVDVGDYCFNQGADGFIYDAEDTWESSNTGLTDGPAMAWLLCSTMRAHWPNKFIAHNPYDTLYSHSSYPCKEFSYWCDCIMPQVYHHSDTAGNASAALNWMDVNYKRYQDTIRNTTGTMNGTNVYWNNSIKPIVPMRNVYVDTPESITEFLDYMAADPNCVTTGGYKGFDGYRSQLFSADQIASMQGATAGTFDGIVNNIVIDEEKATYSGSWTRVITVTCTAGGSVVFSGDTGTDTNPFGVTYRKIAHGTGANYAQFSPNILAAGDYDIYHWHPTRADASVNTPVRIVYEGGTTNIAVNQQSNPGAWSLIARLFFRPGTTSIRFSDATPDGNLALADGIKMAYVYPATVPATPTGLQATGVSSSEIDLSWADNAGNETAYIVSRSPGTNGPWADIATLARNATAYNDSTGLLPGTPYYYYVRATNYLGSSTLSAKAGAATRSTNGTPIIVLQPQGQAVLAGDSPALSVSASGAPPLHYQWYRNGSLQPGATTSALAFTNVQPAQAGDYYVIVSNDVASVTSAVATLTINYSLTASTSGGGTVSRNPDQASYAPNAVVFLTATPATGHTFLGWSGDASGTANPLSVTMNASKSILAAFSGGVSDIIIDNPSADFSVGSWSTGTMSTDKYGADYRFASVAGTVTAVATFRPTILTAGLYDVYVWYPIGGNRSTAAPCNVHYNGGTVTATLNETANGGQWNLVASEKDFIAGTAGYVALANNTAETSKVVMADAVRFSYCAVQTPLIVAQPQSQPARVGTNVRFTVGASGGSLSYQWRFNGSAIPGATQSACGLTSIQATNAGSYTVYISNPVGNALSGAAVLTAVPPARPLVSSCALCNGRLQLQISGESGVSYLVQSTTNFVSWSSLTNLSSPDGLLQFTDPVVDLPQRFYRVQVAQ